MKSDTYCGMSFAAGFYSFRIDLNNVDRSTFEKFHVKTPRHPYETLDYLSARLLAFVHCFKEGQTFTQGLFEPKEPTIWCKDITGNLELWVQVGDPGKKKLEIALRSDPSSDLRVYFINSEEIHHFCHTLRGSKTNWVERVRFYYLEPVQLGQISQTIESSNNWTVTNIDDSLYLVCNGTEISVGVSTVNIWEEYQKSISNAGVEDS